MATVNLGRIKPVFRGAYNNSTAYVIDDIVTSGNETFIAIAATQGNATSNGTFWTKLAAKGADGTDVGAVLANKEIAFKTNAGAVDGIPIGTAGQVLKVNSGATGYEFGADQGGKILKVYNDTDASNITTNSTSYQDTGLSITLTPTSASNDFLIIADLGVTRHASTSASMFVQIMRDSTAVVAHGNGYMGYSGNTNDRGYYPSFFHHLDVPNSTSSITYKIQYKSESSGASVHSYGSRRMTIFEIDGGIE
jgi:hypothetical protein